MTLAITHQFVSGVPDDPAAASAGEVLPSEWDALHNVGGTIGPEIGGRTILTANINVYVATTGSDSNTFAQAQNPATPWATLQHASDTISDTLDLSIFNVNINIGVGTFASVNCNGYVGTNTLVSFIGAGVGSTTVTCTASDAGACFLVFASIYDVNAVTMAPNAGQVGSPNCGVIAQGGIAFVDTVGFTVPAGGNVAVLETAISDLSLIFVDGGQTITVNGTSGGTCNLWNLQLGFAVNVGQWIISGSPVFSPAAVVIVGGATLEEEFGAGAYSGGTPTGPRLNIAGNAVVIDTSTGFPTVGTLGPTFYPGNSFGSVDATSGYDGFPGPLPGIDTQTSSYTLAITDAFEIVEMNNAGANTLTVPTNASVAFEIGTKIWITQTGAGNTTVAGAGGVTVRNAGALSGQWATVKLYKRGTNEWVQTNA